MRTVLRIAGSLALLGWLALRTDWSKLAATFAEVHWPLWLAGVGFFLLATAVSSVRWQLLTRPLGFERSTWDYIRFSFLGVYFGLFLPSIGSEVVRAWYLDAGSGRKRLALLSVLIDRACGLAVLLALTLVAALLYPGALPPWVAVTVWIVTGGALFAGMAAAVALGFPGRSARLLHWRTRALLYASHPRVLAGSVVLSVLNVTAHVLVVWTIGLALDVPIPGAYYWLIVPIVSLATTAPISINGIGVREATTVAMLAPLNVGEETALTLVFLWFAAFTAGGVCGLVFYLFGRRRPDSALLRQMAADGNVEQAEQDGKNGRRAA
jgi:glycosyltransferase 2 family protein